MRTLENTIKILIAIIIAVIIVFSMVTVSLITFTTAELNTDILQIILVVLLFTMSILIIANCIVEQL